MQLIPMIIELEKTIHIKVIYLLLSKKFWKI